MNLPILVEPIQGERSRFLVSSRSRQLSHLVDMEENGGQGKCGCEDFDFNIQPAIDRGERPDPCAHVRQVLDWIERN